MNTTTTMQREISQKVLLGIKRKYSPSKMVFKTICLYRPQLMKSVRQWTKHSPFPYRMSIVLDLGYLTCAYAQGHCRWGPWYFELIV